MLLIASQLEGTIFSDVDMSTSNEKRETENEWKMTEENWTLLMRLRRPIKCFFLARFPTT